VSGYFLSQQNFEYEQSESLIHSPKASTWRSAVKTASNKTEKAVAFLIHAIVILKSINHKINQDCLRHRTAMLGL
jgi:hypothetical protein